MKNTAIKNGVGKRYEHELDFLSLKGNLAFIQLLPRLNFLRSGIVKCFGEMQDIEVLKQHAMDVHPFSRVGHSLAPMVQRFGNKFHLMYSPRTSSCLSHSN